MTKDMGPFRDSQALSGLSRHRIDVPAEFSLVGPDGLHWKKTIPYYYTELKMCSSTLF
jgi:hypothetical protein